MDETKLLPAAERLRRSNVFQRAYAERKSVSSPLLILYVLPRQPRSSPRQPLVGFVVGKKVHNKSHERNRLKRRVREAYRRLRGGEERLTQWYAIVWVVQSKALAAGWQEIVETVGECIRKADRKYGKKPITQGGL